MWLQRRGNEANLKVTDPIQLVWMVKKMASYNAPTPPAVGPFQLVWMVNIKGISKLTIADRDWDETI